MIADSHAELDELVKPSISRHEIEELKALWLTDENNATKRLQFAIVLTRSDRTHEKYEAITHFDYLISTNSYVEESLYYLSIVYYSLGEYEQARKYCEMLYRELPDSSQVRNLHSAITSKYNEKTREQQHQQQTIAVSAGLITLALSGAAIVGIMMSRKK